MTKCIISSIVCLLFPSSGHLCVHDVIQLRMLDGCWGTIISMVLVCILFAVAILFYVKHQAQRCPWFAGIPV